MKKIQRAAIAAKKEGYTHVYSIVKSVYHTEYLHFNNIDDVIKNGWIPAPKIHMRKWHGRYGVTYNNAPSGQHINKSDMLKKYNW